MPNSTTTLNTALISMPWSIFNRPSVQLGALKAYLAQRQDVAVNNYHPYVGVARVLGPETYLYLSKNSWAGEALYASILFPERLAKVKRTFQKSCSDNKNVANRFEKIRDILHSHLNNWADDTDFSKYQLIGFSVCFSQLFATLAASKIIKKKAPDCAMVFGGSSCVGEIGTSLLRQFSQIDYIIDGEGELPLEALCHFLLKKRDSLPQQVLSKTATTADSCGNISDINSLPTPDYNDYFKEVAKEFPHQPFIPTLPLEFSRGCWWEKCTFCNLNLQWQGYRWKTHVKMITELQLLLTTHQCLDFSFCDNALPVKETDSFFEKTRESGRDFRFFAEIRAIQNPENLSLYRKGGLTSVQVGVESLSNTLLLKMNKGTTVIANIAIMKNCLENDIGLEGNLIVEFPGSTEEEVVETLANLDFILPFRPLTPAAFFLGYGSPMEKEPHKFGIRTIIHHRNNVHLFPEDFLVNMEMLIKDFRGDKLKQKKQWQPVVEKMKRWKKFHEDRKNKTIAPLSYRDGGEFIIIRQEQLIGKPLLHRLQGMSRKLYIYCGVIRHINEVKQHFPTLKEKTILNFFDDLCNKKLLFCENNTFLALAVHALRPSEQ